MYKSLEATLLFLNFFKAIESIHRGENGANTSSIWSSHRNCYRYDDAYKNMKAMVCSPDGNTDFFNIVTRVLQGDTLVRYLFIFGLVYKL